MSVSSSQYCEILLEDVVSKGDLVGHIRQQIVDLRRPVVALVMCHNSDPGRSFLRSLMSSRGAPVDLQRRAREALAKRGVTFTVLPIDHFMRLNFPQDIEGYVRDSHEIKHHEGLQYHTVPVVVMGAGGFMVAEISGTDLVIRSSNSVTALAAESPASCERDRRAARSRRRGKR